MPFPIPFLPVMAVALLTASIIPSKVRICSRHEKVDHSAPAALASQRMNHEPSNMDPFSDPPNATVLTPAPDQVAIKVKFIECGSRTDELSFDWIVPFDQPASKK
jgi:hypothetical protein